MNQRILNRAGQLPEDGFYQIEALGEHVNHAAKVVQVIDAKSVDSIVNRFSAEANAAGADFPGMRIDKDHLSSSMENPTESLGWTMELRNRNNVPEAKIAWTALGQPLVETKPNQPPVYKFFSTEYDPRDCEKIGTRMVGGKKYEVIRPLRLAGLSLTNDPNNKGQRPISNRNGGDAEAEKQNHEIMKNALIKMLSMKADASDEDVVAECQKVMNRASTAEGRVTALEKERDTLLSAQVEADLEKYKNRFKPENRETVKQQLITNRTGTIALLESLAPAASKDTARITNRATAQAPERDGAAADEAGEAAKARKIANRANALKASTPNRSFDDCWRQATEEVAAPEQN